MLDDSLYINIYELADLGALRASLPARTPDRWSRTNPTCAQTQTSNKSKFQTNQKVSGLRVTENNPALGGFRIIRR